MDGKQNSPKLNRLGFRRRLWVKLLIAYLTPVALIVVGGGWLAYRAARVAMEAQLGEALISVANTASQLVGNDRSMGLSPGDEQTRTYQNLRTKLGKLRQAAQVELIYLFDLEGKSLVDSNGLFSIGEPIVKLIVDQAELKAVWKGEARSSVLFAGKDGLFYKTGFSPVNVAGKVIGAVGVDGSASFFKPLAELGRTIALMGIGIVILLVLVTWFISRTITRPLIRLEQSASAIGQGEFDREIAVETSDEIGVLANTFNEMRKSIQERDQQLQMMLSGIAHEVRNPLGGMTLFVGLLREELSGNPTALKHLQRISLELDYLSRVVNDFLDFARRRPLELEETDPQSELEQLQNLCAADVEKAQLHLEIDISQNHKKVFWDRERMRQVLLNLIRNAIQACGSGGTIRVSFQSEDEDTLVSVTDNGCGISEERKDQIFTPFFTTRQQGTGLGLALAKKIVEAHGGSIGFSSKPGCGTCFSMRLPSKKIKIH